MRSTRHIELLALTVLITGCSPATRTTHSASTERPPVVSITDLDSTRFGCAIPLAPETLLTCRHILDACKDDFLVIDGILWHTPPQTGQDIRQAVGVDRESLPYWHEDWTLVHVSGFSHDAYPSLNFQCAVETGEPVLIHGYRVSLEHGEHRCFETTGKVIDPHPELSNLNAICVQTSDELSYEGLSGGALLRPANPLEVIGIYRGTVALEEEQSGELMYFAHIFIQPDLKDRRGDEVDESHGRR